MTDSRQLITSIGINKEQISTNSKNINNLIELVARLKKSVLVLKKEISSLSGTIIQGGGGGGGGVGGGGTSSSLAGLTDTAVANIADNHLLQYNSQSQIWENITDLTLPGTLTVTDAASFGSITGAGLNLGGQAYFMNFRHDIQADVTFRGDTYIRKQGNNGNGDVGFYCNTQTNPPRVAICTTQPDDTLTVKGTFGIRESFQAVPALFSQSTTGGGYVLVNTTQQTSGHSLTVNGQTALEGNLKLAGQLGVGATPDPGIPNFILSSQGGNVNPTWIKPYNIDSFYLTYDITNQQVNTDEYIPHLYQNSFQQTWERKDSSSQYNSQLLNFKPSSGFYTTANTAGNLSGVIIEPVDDGSGNNLFRFVLPGVYKITFHATIYARQQSVPDFGHVELQHLLGVNNVVAILERFEVSYNGSSGLIPTTHHGESYIYMQDNDYLRVVINAPNAQSTVLRSGLPYPPGTQGSTLAAAAGTYINFEYLPRF